MMFAGSKFRNIQSRGQQGLGCSGCVLLSQMTTGKPAHVISCYKEGDEMSFSVSLSQDAYLHLFWFDNTVEGKGSCLFPSVEEQQCLFNNGEKIRFPIMNNVYYEVLFNEDSPRCILVAVATHSESPFPSEEVTFSTFVQWLYSIPPKDRTMPVWANFTVFK